MATPSKPPNLASAREFFDAIARRYDRVYALDGAASRARMPQVLGALSPRSRVLVLGVGTGRELSALLDAGHAPVGLDLAPSMLERCRQRARPIPLVEADLWAPLPFDPRSFDAVLALHGTLAHPPAEAAESPAEASLEALAREVARVLRVPGVFVAEVPSPAFAGRLLREGPLAADGFELEATSEQRLVHRDRVAGVAILARVFSEDAWRAAFGGAFDLRVEPWQHSELLVTGRRRGDDPASSAPR